MEKIIVEISWSGNNFNGGWGSPDVGAVIATGKTLQEVKDDFVEALNFHIEGMKEDGDNLPEWLVNGDFEIDYNLNTAALIRSAEEYTSITAISKASGINVKQLSHYANNIKKARPAQHQRIVDGLHKIGRNLIAVR